MNIQKILIAATLICLQLNADFGDVNMVDPDIIETTGHDAPVGTGVSSDHMITPMADKHTKQKKSKKKKNVKKVVKEKITYQAPTPAIINESVKQVPQNAHLVDAIEAVVFAPEGTKIVISSELDRPSLDGKTRTLDDLVYEQLMLLDAQKFKMFPDDEMIDKHLAAVQRDNNLTLDDLKNVFKSAGYSYEQGREQFGVISIINQILDFKIRSRLIVPEREVIAYYDANPETEDASYCIQIGMIPFAYSQTHEEQMQLIEQAIANADVADLDIAWQDPFWIEKNEIAQDKHFLITMNVGTLSEPIELAQGFQVFKKTEEKPEHLKTLEERYRGIVDILRRPKHEQLFNEYKKQLMDDSSVMYLNL